MTKQEFLEQLDKLLCDIPKTEREEAILYYEEYFDEADISDMEDVSGRIDSPEKIAASIRAGLQGNEGNGEFTERGYYENGFGSENELMRNGEVSDGRKQDNKTEDKYFNKNKSGVTDEKVPLDKSKIILIVIIAVLTLPIWGGLLGGLIGILVGILGAIFGIVVAAIAVTFSLLVCGVVFIVVGAVKTTAVPIAGITSIGIGLLCFGIGMLCLMFMVWLCSALIPSMCRGIKWVWSRITGKKA